MRRAYARKAEMRKKNERATKLRRRRRRWRPQQHRTRERLLPSHARARACSYNQLQSSEIQRPLVQRICCFLSCSLWGNKELTSQYEEYKCGKYWDKISSTASKWSNSNAPSNETPVSHSLLGLSLSPFSAPAASFLPLFGVIRNWTSQYES